MRDRTRVGVTVLLCFVAILTLPTLVSALTPQSAPITYKVFYFEKCRQGFISTATYDNKATGEIYCVKDGSFKRVAFDGFGTYLTQGIIESVEYYPDYFGAPDSNMTTIHINIHQSQDYLQCNTGVSTIKVHGNSTFFSLSVGQTIRLHVEMDSGWAEYRSVHNADYPDGWPLVQTQYCSTHLLDYSVVKP